MSDPAASMRGETTKPCQATGDSADLTQVREAIGRAFETMRAMPNVPSLGFRLAHTVGRAIEPPMPPEIADPVRHRRMPLPSDISAMDRVMLDWLPRLRGVDPRVLFAVVRHAQGQAHASIGRELGISGQYVGRLEKSGLTIILNGLHDCVRMVA